jgi:hypothetical protein
MCEQEFPMRAAVSQEHPVRPQDRPRFRENVWWVDAKTDKALLRTLTRTYETPVAVALAFLAVRTHCTGHNSLEDIAKRSGCGADDVRDLLAAFAETDMFYPEGASSETVDLAQVRDRFSAAVALWAEEAAATRLPSPAPADADSRPLAAGVAVEACHESLAADAMLREAERRCASPLRELAAACRRENAQATDAALRTAAECGLSEEEVRTSAPLPSGRLIDFLLRALIDLEPAAFLMAVSLLAARRLDLAFGAEERYFRLTLFAEHAERFDVGEISRLDAISNTLHDLVHAFILQAQEIKAYYGRLAGNYLPRQPVGFYAL